jgi:hypothetical protein
MPAIGAAPPLMAAILGFGVSALLYLMTEELLLEEHEAGHAADHGDLLPRLSDSDCPRPPLSGTPVGFGSRSCSFQTFVVAGLT